MLLQAREQFVLLPVFFKRVQNCIKSQKLLYRNGFLFNIADYTGRALYTR